jgi:hypothetical protein
MKFTLAQAHIDHFRKTGAIEFEDIFSEKECTALLSQVEAILTKKTVASDRFPLDYMSNENLFLQGKNLWKEGLEVKKLSTKKQLGEIAYHFFRKKPIKLAYDQYIRTGDVQDCPFKEDAPLSLVSSIRPLLGAAMILLEPSSLSLDTPFLPKKAGSVLFISSSATIPFKQLFNEKNLSMIVLAFTAEKPIYCLEKNDPHTHDLKKEGLVFGDSVGEDLCPTLYYP